MSGLRRWLGRWNGSTRADDLLLTADPLGLIELLCDHGFSEATGLFLYFPWPPRERDREARAWLEVLRAKRVIRAGWVSEPEDVARWIGRSHQHLFEGGPSSFEVFRLDRQKVEALINQLC